MPGATEEQIMIPELDTKLGQVGDVYVKAYERFLKAEKALEEATKNATNQLQVEGLDKCAFIGKEFKVTVRLEHVESHDKLKRSVTANKE